MESTVKIFDDLRKPWFRSNSYNPTKLLKEQDKQLHYGAGMIVSTLGYTWSYNKHQDKKRDDSTIENVRQLYSIQVQRTFG